MENYIITKDQCQEMIDSRGDVVCSCCGGKIEPCETVDNANNPTYWAACLSCQIVSAGVPRKVYDAAKIMVEEHNLRPYPHELRPSTSQKEAYGYWKKMQISGACRIVQDVAEVIGFEF